MIGRPAGSYPGFVYSDLNKAAAENGLVWNEDLIFAYLPDPTAFLKKYLTDKGKPELAIGISKMILKLPSEEDRKNVIVLFENVLGDQIGKPLPSQAVGHRWIPSLVDRLVSCIARSSFA